MTPRRWITLASCVLALLAALGGAWWINQPGPPTRLRIGISPWPGYEFIYLAEQKGFFKEEGLDVEIKQFSSPEEDVRNAFEQGKIEGMCNAVPDTLRSYVHSRRQPRIVLAIDYSNGADVILAKAPFRTFKDLKGKSIAVEPLSLGMVMLYRAAQLEEMKLTDFKLLNFSQSEMEKALSENKVDAVVTYPPVSLQVQNALETSIVFDSAKIPGEIADVLALDAKFIDEHPDAVPALRRAWSKALAYAANHKEEAYGIMATRERIDSAAFEESLQGIRIIPASEQAAMLKPGGPMEASIAATIATLESAGALEGFRLNPADFIYNFQDER